MSTSPLLINEHPLMVLPSLATAVGLNQAIVLQQVHYWLDLNRKVGKDSHYRDDCWWTYNTFESWQEFNFPFWSVRTLKRIFKSLEDEGLLIARKFNQDDWNHTKWYTIDYEALNNLALSIVPDCHDRSCQSGTKQGDNLAPSSISTETNSTETNSRTTTTERPKRKKSSSSECVSMKQAEAIADFVQGHGYYGEDGEPYTYRKTKPLIQACVGHDEESARKAVMAAWEFMQSERLSGKQIKSAQAVICRALMDRLEPSADYEAGQVRAAAEAAEKEKRDRASEYVLEWLHVAEARGLIEVLYISKDKYYSYRLPSDPTVRQAQLWELPKAYAGVSLQYLMEEVG